jgi:hypothetical protein
MAFQLVNRGSVWISVVPDRSRAVSSSPTSLLASSSLPPTERSGSWDPQERSLKCKIKNIKACLMLLDFQISIDQLRHRISCCFLPLPTPASKLPPLPTTAMDLAAVVGTTWVRQHASTHTWTAHFAGGRGGRGGSSCATTTGMAFLGWAGSEEETEDFRSSPSVS